MATLGTAVEHFTTPEAHRSGRQLERGVRGVKHPCPSEVGCLIGPVPASHDTNTALGPNPLMARRGAERPAEPPGVLQMLERTRGSIRY